MLDIMYGNYIYLSNIRVAWTINKSHLIYLISNLREIYLISNLREIEPQFGFSSKDRRKWKNRKKLTDCFSLCLGLEWTSHACIPSGFSLECNKSQNDTSTLPRKCNYFKLSDSTNLDPSGKNLCTCLHSLMR